MNNKTDSITNCEQRSRHRRGGHATLADPHCGASASSQYMTHHPLPRGHERERYLQDRPV